MNIPILETQRLILRPFQMSDVKPSYEMNLDPEVTKYTGDGGVVSFKEIERRIVEDVMGDYKKFGYGRLAVELKDENTFIGFCGLKFVQELREVDLGFRFMKKFWGKGYATESATACISFGFEALALKRIVGLVIPQNIGSVNVLTKLGFRFEKNIVEDGMLIDQYVLTQLNA